MQLRKSLYIVGACAAVLSTASAMAQNSGNGTGNGTSAPREWRNSSQVVNCGGTGSTLTPAQVQAMVRQFQADREAFTACQNALKAQLASAPEADRQRLRDQLKDQMQTWKEQQARLRDQLKDQTDRLRDQLRDHDRLMDCAANPGTGAGQGASGKGGAGPRGR